MPKFIPIRPSALHQQAKHHSLGHESECDLASPKLLGPKRTFVPLTPRAHVRASRACSKDGQETHQWINKEDEISEVRNDQSLHLRKHQISTPPKRRKSPEKIASTAQKWIPKMSSPAQLAESEPSDRYNIPNFSLGSSPTSSDSEEDEERNHSPETKFLGVMTIDAVGCRYYKSAAVQAEPGNMLQLLREPMNRYDPLAIRVQSQVGQIGHVPRKISCFLSPLIDSNVLILRGKVSDNHIIGQIEKTIPIEVEVRISSISDVPDQRDIESKVDLLKSFLKSSSKSIHQGNQITETSTTKRQATIDEILGRNGTGHAAHDVISREENKPMKGKASIKYLEFQEIDTISFLKTGIDWQKFMQKGAQIELHWSKLEWIQLMQPIRMPLLEAFDSNVKALLDDGHEDTLQNFREFIFESQMFWDIERIEIESLQEKHVQDKLRTHIMNLSRDLQERSKNRRVLEIISMERSRKVSGMKFVQLPNFAKDTEEELCDIEWLLPAIESMY
eukprot:767177-Hanusia_phi.AAC.3